MITSSFDNKSLALINPAPIDNVAKCDVVIATFSNLIEDYVVSKHRAEKINESTFVNGTTPIYTFKYNNRTFGFYKTLLGAPATAAMLDEVSKMFDCKKYVFFGSAGTLDKSCFGKVMIPTHAYRDEGTSYHYVKPDDYIEIKNSTFVEKFMKKHNIPYKMGKTWTTDAFYRETKNNLQKRQEEGCISVDMECSAVQAVCNFRGLDLYYFFLSGDLLDAPVWDRGGLSGANHNHQNFDIALHLAEEI